MSSGFSANQILNLVLATGLGALAMAASMELRSQPIEVSRLVRDAQEILNTADHQPVSEARATVETSSREKKPAEDVAAVQSAPEETVTNSVPSEPTRAPATALAFAETNAPYVPGAPDALAKPINVSALSTKMQAAMPMEQAIRTPVVASAEDAVAEPAAAAAADAVPEPAARPPVAPETRTASLAAKPGVIFEDTGHKACIGGTQCEAQCKAEPDGCEVKPTYTIRLDQPTYISAVQFYAHDDVGPSRRSELFVKVNGEPIGKIEAHRYGSTRTVKIGRVGQLVTIESRHKHNGFLLGGEEAVIWDVYLLGREAR